MGEWMALLLQFEDYRRQRLLSLRLRFEPAFGADEKEGARGSRAVGHKRGVKDSNTWANAFARHFEGL